MTPDLAKDRIIRHFDGSVSHWASLYDTPSSQTTYNDKLYRLQYVAQMSPPGPGVALDVGCGAGQFLSYLTRLGYTATGLEISRPMADAAVERLRRENNRAAIVLMGDCENIPLPDRSIDLYTAMGVIEYMGSDDPMIRECRRILKPGGTGIITARNLLCPAVRWRFFYEDRAKPVASKIVAPLRNGRIPPARIPISREHSPFALKRTLRRNGFDILDQRFCHFYVLPHPFGQMFRPLESVLARPLEALAHTPLGILGSTYIVKFRKHT